jgi:hypothetical protein
MLGPQPLDGEGFDPGYTQLRLGLCHQVRSEVNGSLQLLTLSARQLYRRHRAVLKGRPLLISPRSLLALSRESSRELTVEEDGLAVCIKHNPNARSPTARSPACSAAALPCPPRPAAREDAGLAADAGAGSVSGSGSMSVSANVLEACRNAESAHQHAMVKILGSKIAESMEQQWRSANIECVGARCGSCGDLLVHGFCSAARCRPAHRGLMASSLCPAQREIFEDIWKSLL